MLVIPIIAYESTDVLCRTRRALSRPLRAPKDRFALHYSAYCGTYFALAGLDRRGAGNGNVISQNMGGFFPTLFEGVGYFGGLAHFRVHLWAAMYFPCVGYIYSVSLICMSVTPVEAGEAV